MTLRVVAGDPTDLERSVGDYLASVRARGRSIHTRSQYESVLRRVLVPWARREGIFGVEQLDQRALDRFGSELLEVGGPKGPLSRASCRTYLRTVGFFLTWARREGMATEARPQLPQLPRRILETLNRAEIRAIEDAATTERDKILIRLLADTGCRVAEALGLSPADLIEHGRDRFIRVIGKGDKQRDVPIQPALFARLTRLATKGRPADAASDRIFLSLRRRGSGLFEPLTTSGLEQALREAAERAGIARRVYPHLLRHSFVKWALQRGLSPIHIARLVGHEGLEMVNRAYANLTASDASAQLMRALQADDD